MYWTCVLTPSFEIRSDSPHVSWVKPETNFLDLGMPRILWRLIKGSFSKVEWGGQQGEFSHPKTCSWQEELSIIDPKEDSSIEKNHPWQYPTTKMYTVSPMRNWLLLQLSQLESPHPKLLLLSNGLFFFFFQVSVPASSLLLNNTPL